MAEQVIIVHLRRPRLNDSDDSRRDPFWEFGSFGLTGCHSRNLMHPKRADELNGIRLAFVQGGHKIMKLVYLSPPIEAIRHKNAVEARWEPSMPFNFISAPLIINNCGETMFPQLKQTFFSANRDTWVRKFSSRFRARRNTLPDSVTKELTRRFDLIYANGNGYLAKTYEQALPFNPVKIDRNRLNTYKELLLKANS